MEQGKLEVMGQSVKMTRNAQDASGAKEHTMIFAGGQPCGATPRAVAVHFVCGVDVGLARLEEAQARFDEGPGSTDSSGNALDLCGQRCPVSIKNPNVAVL